MGKHLVLVGGGHAHMVTLAKLHNFIEKGYHLRLNSITNNLNLHPNRRRESLQGRSR